ncbi:MAG TPA: NAD-dependent epimerase/dehydratase family protein [Myxococcota bacterium]|nr:NAD-dependent epimerase/dehydratase family protein [Myxococcota bacterium]HRY94156.1 NAD-dependent epimerase/dehydratase family protein [Myxococcota bacterium]
MKILVTGGAGFIGSHVADRMLTAGHEVLIADDLSTGRERNLPSRAAFTRLDIRSPAFEEYVLRERPEAVCHLAAQIDVRRSVADPLLDAGINVLGSLRLAKAAAQAGCRQIIFSSTGGAIYGEQDVFPAGEEHPCRPVSPYGASKLCAEAMLGYFARTGGPALTCLRYANVYGPRQDPHGEAGVVAIFCGRLLQGQAPTIYGDGGQTRDFVYVGDVAEANLRALERGRDGVFNIGTGLETEVNTIARLLIEASGFQGAARYAPGKPGEQRRSVIDPGRAGRELGWRPTVPLAEGLRRTLEFFRGLEAG